MIQHLVERFRKPQFCRLFRNKLATKLELQQIVLHSWFELPSWETFKYLIKMAEGLSWGFETWQRIGRESTRGGNLVRGQEKGTQTTTCFSCPSFPSATCLKRYLIWTLHIFHSKPKHPHQCIPSGTTPPTVQLVGGGVGLGGLTRSLKCEGKQGVAAKTWSLYHSSILRVSNNFDLPVINIFFNVDI